MSTPSVAALADRVQGGQRAGRGPVVVRVPEVAVPLGRVGQRAGQVERRSGLLDRLEERRLGERHIARPGRREPVGEDLLPVGDVDAEQLRAGRPDGVAERLGVDAQARPDPHPADVVQQHAVRVADVDLVDHLLLEPLTRQLGVELEPALPGGDVVVEPGLGRGHPGPVAQARDARARPGREWPAVEDGRRVLGARNGTDAQPADEAEQHDPGQRGEQGGPHGPAPGQHASLEPEVDEG